MKNFYYFSKNKLKFVEIRNFRQKFIFLVLFFSLLISFFVFGGYFIIKEIINPDAALTSLKDENKELQGKLKSLVEQYKNLNSQLDKLETKSNDLRLATNLEPLDSDDQVGVGGKVFEELNSYNSKDINKLLTSLNSIVDNITAKVEIEKNNYTEIEKTLKDNEKLYDALPAVKPCEGPFGDSFGLRFHPILKIRRMHNGQDIIADIGTKVYAPGAGKVDFIGRRGGSGLTLEIDHGFGYRTIYMHLSNVKVKYGQTVKRGDLIALTGNSGKLSTGPHLHYEVRHDGIALDPRNFMYDDVNIFDIIAKK